jgi:two-component system, chemotaxis family, chemotaxis protein CheY
MSNLQTIRVLVVDDQKLMQHLVADVLKELGFRAITMAATGREAMTLVRLRMFDFIITDWRMPDMDGIDLIRFIRTGTHLCSLQIPIILLTGNAASRDVLTARDAGVNEYVIKPFTAAQLTKRIRSIIEKPRAFVAADGYCGPDRRHTNQPPPHGIERRKQAMPLFVQG